MFRERANMSQETIDFYNFLVDKGYIDENLNIKSVEIKLTTEGLPLINVEYHLEKGLYNG